jgi:hypothetical protein
MRSAVGGAGFSDKLLGGRNPLDWVATFPWTGWQHSCGLGGRNPWNTQVAQAEGKKGVDWKTLLAYITGSVDQHLLLRNAYACYAI